jgi:hydroxymethylpyrimidine pyrophosphatase-like HAD family hydrolase
MRLIACDLDGTVVRLDGTISSRTLVALAACDKAGVLVVFVTGRPVRWMAPVVEMTRRSGVAVCSNGAVSLDLSDNRIIELRPLSHKAVLESVKRLRAALPPVVFAVDTLGGYGSEPGYFRDQSANGRAVVGPLSTVMDQGPPPIKLLCRLASTSSAPAITADEMLELARTVLADVAEPVHSNPAGSLLEISALGVSKATTLARYVHSLGLGARDVVAFGDMPNDIPMLRWAGRGYAMSDGHPDAIGAATAVAPPCPDDGVAQVIEQILAKD